MTTPNETIVQEKDLDFLPERYREQTAQRKGRAWRLSTIVLLGMMLPVASFYQLRVRSKLQKQLAEIQPRCVTLDAYHAQLKAIQQKQQHLEAMARVIAYLHHPWPRSQVLSALLPKLPDSVTLTSIQIDEMAGTGAAVIANPKNPHQENTAQVKEAHPGDADLKQLRERHDKAQVVVLLAGTSTDPGPLHEYLGKLAEHPLFTKTELLSLETPAAKTPAGGSSGEAAQFRALLIVAQGPGQPQGPQPNVESRPTTGTVAGRAP